jgi:chemotaxis methyl-accepting protein methylase
MTTEEGQPPERGEDACPIVGIGCSAGGLEALEAFFSHVPRSPGVAFVVVQHLDPAQPSALVSLLQATTTLAVEDIGAGAQVQADHVYVLPPGRTVVLTGDRLVTTRPDDVAELRRSVDTFFRSLADARHDGAIAVVLSGMGVDGLAGVRAVKDAAGLVLAQDPTTARESSMPRAAIDAAAVDVVGAPAVLAARAVVLAQRPPRSVGESDADNVDDDELDAIVALLRARGGADFALYKKSTLRRRIHRRVVLHQLPSVSAYVAYLQSNTHEIGLLFKELLIGVTSFFRDPSVWENLRDLVFPELFAHFPQGHAFRAWVPACSTGEEAYSLAIVFQEAVSRSRLPGRFTLQVYATDLDSDAIGRARRGLFPRDIGADVSSERLASFFVAEDGGYRVGREIRDMVVFAPQNVASDPPFTRLDVISCRNLLIYFQPELQRKLLPIFHYALNPGGFLVLGSAETVGPFGHLFSAEDSKGRIYRRVGRPSTSLGGFTPRLSASGFSAADDLGGRRGDELGALVDDFIRQRFTPAAVLVNADGDILYFSGRTGKYLEPAAGKVNVNLHAMAREGLREALVGVVPRALRQVEAIRIDGVRIGGRDEGHVVNVVVQALDGPSQLRGRAIVLFEDAAEAGNGTGPGTSTVADAVTAELLQTREALRLTREEMQASLEDLKSANEELQSTNEELQSTNEELTTSKEEMQALNEELQTVNAELQSKVDDLTWERNDMTNLLNSVEVATVFLDNDMKVRRFTTHATRLFKLIPGDVGRPLSDIVNDLDYPNLIDDAREVLRTLVFRERNVVTRDARWFRVKWMPYRTLDNVIGGIIGTFTETTELKRLESELESLRKGRQP